MHTSAAEFEDFIPNLLEGRKIEESFPVIAQISFGAVAGLHSVGSDQLARARIVNHQVIADEVELVAVEAGSRGGVKPFAQFTIEDQVTQALAGDEVVERFGQSDAKERSAGEGISAAVLQDGGCCHKCSFG